MITKLDDKLVRAKMLGLLTLEEVTVISLCCEYSQGIRKFLSDKLLPTFDDLMSPADEQPAQPQRDPMEADEQRYNAEHSGVRNSWSGD